MSNQDIKGLSKSELKMKLSKMGMSLDKREHPKNYYEKMYLNTSNAKNKVTRNNTPFYNERIINRKRERERTSDKKKKIDIKQLSGDYPFSDEEEQKVEEKENYILRERKYMKSKNRNIGQNEKIIKDSNSGIKTTRLIMSKQKKDKKIYKSDINNNDNDILNRLRSPRTRRRVLNKNTNTIDDDYIYYDEGYKSKSKLRNKNSQNIKKNEKKITKKPIDKKQSPQKEKNIIYQTLKNDTNNYNENNINDFIDSTIKKSPQNDYILNVNENDNFRKEVDNAISDKNELKLFNENPNNIQNTLDFDQNQNNDELKDTPSEYSASTSRFSRFTNYSLLSLGKIGSGFISMKNCIMNKFRRNAYLFPLVLLILFGILFFFNERHENFERRNLIIIFSIIMGLIVLFNLYKYLKDLRKYKKIAKEDKKKLMELFERENIQKEDIENKYILLEQFFKERIQDNNLEIETYMKYVFPHLVKYLRKDGYILRQQNIEENELNYWKKY